MLYRKPYRKSVLLVLMQVVLALASTSARGQEADPEILVQAHCSGCHSLSLVSAQRGDRTYWERTIRWMQRTQNLWQIPPAQESVILDYLASKYSEAEWGRRPNLPPQLVRIASE